MSPAFTKGEKRVWITCSIFTLKTTLIVPITMIIIAAGITASKERATELGTCSGILNIIFLVLQNRKTSTAKMAKTIHGKIPTDPSDSIGNINP